RPPWRARAVLSFAFRLSRSTALGRTTARLTISFGGRFGKGPVDALEEPLDLPAVAVRHAAPQGCANRLRIFGRAPLHAPSLGRQEDAAHTEFEGVSLAANETPLLQAPEDGRHRVRVRAGPFHDRGLRDPWLSCHDGEQHELVGGHALGLHPGIGTA